MSDLPIKVFATKAAWSAWLEKNHAKAKGVWIRHAKKDAKLKSVSYMDAISVALCYGWIDGQRKAYDAESFIQKFTPRGPRSIWSKINREKAEALIKARKMRPAGLAAVENAKSNGRWDAAYEGQKTVTMPPDLKAAFDANPKAKAFYESLNSQNRYAILFRVLGVKRPETRARNIEKFVAMCAAGKTIYPQAKK